MAGQDTRKLIPAGQTLPISGVNGDYIYLKFSDRPVDIIIGNSRVTMEAGDKYRPDERFQSFELENPDPDNPAQVIFTIGRGDYNRQIVTGQITTTIGIRTGQGDFIADTRKKLNLDVISVPGTGITENYGQVVKSFFQSPDEWEYPLADGFFFSSNASYFRSFDYNPAVHDGVIVLGGREPGNLVRWAVEIDPFTQALIRDLGAVNASTEARAVTRFGNVLYCLEANGTEGIYKRTIGQTSWELVAQFANGTALTVDSEGNLYAINSSNTLRKFGPNGNVLATLSVPGFTKAGFGWKTNDVLWVIDTTGAVYQTDKQLSGVTSVGDMGPDTEPCTIVGNYFYAMEFGTSSVKVNARATETVVDLFAGRAYLACENAWLGKKPEALTAIRTTADISVQGGETSNPTVSGEIIKLILEWYLGGPVPLTYMDFIHAIEISGSSDLNGISYPPINIQSNGQTFLAAKIPDDFRVIFPITAKLTIDQRAEQ